MSKRAEPSSILFINRVYPPARGATGQLLAELAAELARAGWQVMIARADGISRSNSYWRRAANYLGAYIVLAWRALRLPRADVVVTMTDPPLQIVLGAAISVLRGSKHVHWAQDIYPELAEKLGVIKEGGLLARILRGISTAAMKRCASAVAIGDCMKQQLLRRGISADKITVIPNWAPRFVAATAGEISAFRKEHGLDQHFAVMYSGNIGLAHCFDAILDAAECLQRTDPNIVFVVVGDGPRADTLRQDVTARRLRSFRFIPSQPLDRLGVSLAAGDLHLASMKEELLGLVVPSKVYGPLAAGRPCFFVGPAESEAARVISRCGGGEVFDSLDSAKLADSIRTWANDPALRLHAAQKIETGKIQVDCAASLFGNVLRSALRPNDAASTDVAAPKLAPSA